MSGRRVAGMDWAPSSPDLTACDYWLHSYLKVLSPPALAPLHLHLHLCTRTFTSALAPLHLHLCICTTALLNQEKLYRSSS